MMKDNFTERGGWKGYRLSEELTDKFTKDNFENYVHNTFIQLYTTANSSTQAREAL